MKKLLFFMAAANLCAMTAFAASADKSSSGKSSDRDTAAVVKDEQADNAKDKPLVKKASPRARQRAKEEANKTKAQGNKGDTSSDNPSK